MIRWYSTLLRGFCAHLTRNLRLWGDFGDVCWEVLENQYDRMPWEEVEALGALWGTLGPLGHFGGKIALAYLLFTPDRQMLLHVT
jgi:hypothetical protein